MIINSEIILNPKNYLVKYFDFHIIDHEPHEARPTSATLTDRDWGLQCEIRRGALATMAKRIIRKIERNEIGRREEKNKKTKKAKKMQVIFQKKGLYRL